MFSDKLSSLSDIPIIDELKKEAFACYSLSSEKLVLAPLIDEHEVFVVAGAFFGDEGKGKTVAAIAKHPGIGLVARTNSGENAGHTVYFEGKKFVFHLAASGIFSGKKNAIGPNCVMDPISFFEKEIKGLTQNNIDYSNLVVGNVSIVTPYHKIIDALGKANSSTLKGMSPAHASKVRKKGLRLDDLFCSPARQKILFEEDMVLYHALLTEHKITEEELFKRFTELNSDGNKRIPDHVLAFLKSKDKIDFLIKLYQEHVVNNNLFPKRADVQRLIQNTLRKGEKVLLEGPQSFFLSNNIPVHWRSSTSADTTSAGIKSAAGYNQELYSSLTINIHKNPASSRVGLGSNPSGFVPQDYFSNRKIRTLASLDGVCEDFDAIQKKFFNSIGKNGILKVTNYKDKGGKLYPLHVAMAIASSKEYGEKGATTLKPRITGLFDCVAHYFVNQTQGPNLSISAVDRGDVCDYVGLVVAYAVSLPDKQVVVANGQEYKHGDIIRPGDALPSEGVLEYCVPVIKVLDGWKATPIAATNGELAELPEEVNIFLSEISLRTGANILSIGNGPKTEDLLYLKKA